MSAGGGTLRSMDDGTDRLSVRDTMRIRLADTSRGNWFQRAGQIRDQLGESETEMWMTVNRLIDDPVAVAAMPVECARLRRKRDKQKAARSQARLAG